MTEQRSVFEALEMALIMGEVRRIRTAFTKQIMAATDEINQPSYDEPFGYQQLSQAAQKLLSEAEPAILDQAEKSVYQKLLASAERVIKEK